MREEDPVVVLEYESTEGGNREQLEDAILYIGLAEVESEREAIDPDTAQSVRGRAVGQRQDSTRLRGAINTHS